MLDTIRKRKENFFYSFIILAVVIVMGFFGVGKMAGEKNQDGIAAWVNGEPISQREFRQMLEYKMLQYQSMLGGQYDEKLLNALQVPQRTLEELVQYKLLSQQAKKLGVLVPDSELADNIRSLPMYQKDGKFDAESYSKLPNRGVEEKRQRERLQTLRLQNYLADRIKLTPNEIQKNYFLKETKAELEYAKIDFASLAAKTNATKAETEAFLKSAAQNDLQLYYDSHKDAFTEKAQAHIKQIRIGVPFKASDTVRAEAKKKMEAIAKEVTPQNFSDLAKKKSDDEYAKKGGEVGWIARGSLEAPLEKALDGLQPGTVSPVIETTYGFFLVHLLEKKDAVLKPLEQVKTTVAENMLQEERKKKFVEDKRKEWEAIVAAGKPLDAELKKAKIEIKKTGTFSLGQGFVPNIGQVDTMVDALFELTKEHPVAKKLFFFQDHYYYVKLLSLELPKKEDFAKNSEMVEKSVTTALQGELINAWIKDLQKKSQVKTEVAFGNNQPESEQN